MPETPPAQELLGQLGTPPTLGRLPELLHNLQSTPARTLARRYAVSALFERLSEDEPTPPPAATAHGTITPSPGDPLLNEDGTVKGPYVALTPLLSLISREITAAREDPPLVEALIDRASLVLSVLRYAYGVERLPPTATQPEQPGESAGLAERSMSPATHHHYTRQAAQATRPLPGLAAQASTQLSSEVETEVTTPEEAALSSDEEDQEGQQEQQDHPPDPNIIPKVRSSKSRTATGLNVALTTDQHIERLRSLNFGLSGTQHLKPMYEARSELYKRIYGHEGQVSGPSRTVEHYDAGLLCEIFFESIMGYEGAYHLYKTCQELSDPDHLDLTIKDNAYANLHNSVRLGEHRTLQKVFLVMTKVGDLGASEQPDGKMASSPTTTTDKVVALVQLWDLVQSLAEMMRSAADNPASTPDIAWQIQHAIPDSLKTRGYVTRVRYFLALKHNRPLSYMKRLLGHAHAFHRIHCLCPAFSVTMSTKGYNAVRKLGLTKVLVGVHHLQHLPIFPAVVQTFRPISDLLVPKWLTASEHYLNVLKGEETGILLDQVALPRLPAGMIGNLNTTTVWDDVCFGIRKHLGPLGGECPPGVTDADLEMDSSDDEGGVDVGEA